MQNQFKTFGLAVAAVSLFALSQSSPARAGVAIDIEPVSGQNTTVTEGNDLTLSFTMTNTQLTGTYVVDGSGTPVFTSTGGDSADLPTGLKSVVTFPAACGNLTPTGTPTDTCTFSVTLTTGPADSDNNSGTSSFELPILIRLTTGSDFGEDAFIESITVNDPVGATSVPEPASLAIFGAGLAALGVMRRKRKAS